jgi:dCTP deaminase
MTLLHWEALEAAMKETTLDKRLVFMPMLDPQQVGPASVDLRLGTKFRILRRTDESGLDPGNQPQVAIERMTTTVDVEIGGKLWLHPGQFVLGATFEFLRLPHHLGAYVVGRSSWGRVGLLVATAIFVQPGFSGCLTLELVNHGESPIALYPGSRIAQLAVHSLPSATTHYYGSGTDKYLGSTGPQVSHLAKESAEIQRLLGVGEQLAIPGVCTQTADF